MSPAEILAQYGPRESMEYDVVAGFWLQLEMWGPQVAIDYQVETVQVPDPRQPKAQVPFTIWQWDGTQPKPAVERPGFQTVTTIHNLASLPPHAVATDA